MNSTKSVSPIVLLENVTYCHETSNIATVAVNSISLQLYRNEFIAITGPSGSGKSTLLSVLGLLVKPSIGRVIIFGEDIYNVKKPILMDAKKDIFSFVYQSFFLIEDMTLFENVELPLLYRKKLTKKQRKDKIKRLLSELGLQERMYHFPYQVSGGQKQKTAIARALISDPKVLLADEPTGNLDSKSSKQIFDIFKALSENGTTVCMVTHDISMASGCDRILRLTDGAIVPDEKSDQRSL